MPGGSGRKHDNGLIVECPHCGCPNRSFDSRCAYCREDISAQTVSKSPGFFGALASRFKKRGSGDDYFENELAPPRGFPLFLRSATAFIVAFLLAAGGLYAVYLGISGGGALHFCIGLLLLIYGIAGFGNINRKEEKGDGDTYLQ